MEINNTKRIWYILDEIAVKHSSTHCGSGNKPCPICDRTTEAMSLCLEKPNHEECNVLYQERGENYEPKHQN
jgi:hypothetical protein